MPGFYSITPFTLLDYPGEMACIAWFAGCNMRCVYCHNPDIVTGKGDKDDEELLSFLKGRIGRLGAVVFSGGEATLYQGLPALMRKVKEMGFKIKLDTNGSRPEVLRGLLAEGLLDYVAMDYKCPKEKAEKLLGTSKLWEPFRESLALLIEAPSGVMPAKAGIPFVSKENGTPACAGVTEGKEGDAGSRKIIFEVRTTIHPDLLSEEDVAAMIRDLDEAGYKGTYYLQLIQSFGEKTIGNVAEPLHVFDRAKLSAPKGFKLGYRNFRE